MPCSFQRVISWQSAARTDAIEVADRGERPAFTFADPMRYHGPASPGGVALGYKMLELVWSRSVPGGELSNAVTAYHAAWEAAVEASGLTWTHLRPSSFMSNTLRLAPQLAAGDVVREPFGDVRT